jgi:hypothetical protein
MIVRCLSKKMFFNDEHGDEIIKRKRENNIDVLHFKWGSSIKFYVKNIELKLIPKLILQKLETKAYIIKTSDENQIIIQFLEEEGRFLKLDNDGIIHPVSLDSINIDDSIATYNKSLIKDIKDNNEHDWNISDIDIIEKFTPDDIQKKEKNYFFSYGFLLEKGHGIVINNFLLYN